MAWPPGSGPRAARRADTAKTPASRAAGNPGTAARTVRQDGAASLARPPPVAILVKELELLGYRWAYRVIDLRGAY